MQVKFESTINDYVDAYERLMARSSTARSWRRQGAAATALLSGLITGILVFIIAGGAFPASLVGGSIAAIASAAISWNLHHYTVKRRLENYFREKFGERRSFPVEIELNESGIYTKQLGTQIIFEWANVEDINETAILRTVFRVKKPSKTTVFRDANELNVT